MPDKRRHRGPDPRDARLFAEAVVPTLRAAGADYGWLLGRGYSPVAALKLVGDRFQLAARQRDAIRRGVCAPDRAAQRAARRRPLAGQVAIDGFNVLVTLESLLSGAPVFRGVDGALRDLAGVHGTWRRVEETRPALDAITEVLGDAEALWVLDRPVSNSGRLAAMLRERGWQAEVVDAADPVLAATGLPVATSDGPLIDRCAEVVDLVSPRVTDTHWVVDLSAAKAPGRTPT